MQVTEKGTYSLRESILFNLPAKEINKYVKEKQIKLEGFDQVTYATPRVEFPQNIAINILKNLFSSEVLEFSKTNRAAYLLIHNANSKFWDQYSRGIINLNPNPEKPVFSCMINAGETELWSLVNKWISRIEPSQTYIFQASFISPADKKGVKTLLEPAFEIQVGKDSDKPIISKWIFRNEFIPKFCQLPNIIKNNPNAKIPRNFTYFNIENMPSFIKAYENETVEAELFLCLLKKEFPKLKLRDRTYYKGVPGGFTMYANSRKMEYTHRIPCLKDPELYDAIIANTIAPIYASTLPRNIRGGFYSYMQNKAAYLRKKKLLELKKIEGKPQVIQELEFFLDQRIKTISSPDYERLPTVMQPNFEVPKPAVTTGTECNKATVVVVVACVAALLFSSFVSKT